MGETTVSVWDTEIEEGYLWLLITDTKNLGQTISKMGYYFLLSN